jgi:chromosome segregation ATPase
MQRFSSSVGVAEHLFSDDYAALVAQEKLVWELQTSKQQFLELLHEVSRELLDAQDRDIALTSQSLLSAIARVRDEITATQNERAAVVGSLVEAVSKKTGQSASSAFEGVADRLAELRAKNASVRQAHAELQTRATELEEYYNTLDNELARLQRAMKAGETLADLKVTHCPACDQPIDPAEDETRDCYVCRRPKPASGDGAKRLAFEIDHVRAEQEETRELLTTLQRDITAHAVMRKDIGSEIRKLEALLQPTQRAAASILPPEIAILDTRAGQLQQRLEQLQRIREMFARREKITERIAQIEKSISSLTEKVREKMQVANLEQGSDWLSDGMNDYLNEIDRRQPHAWPHAPVSVRLRERGFDILVGRARWNTTLGGTLTLYFLIAYHYGLLTLFQRPGCHYPGLLILDFPPVLEDGSSVKDKENFVVEPFVGLTAKPEFADTQLIAAGSSFEGLAGAHRIELTRVWAAGAIQRAG